MAKYQIKAGDTLGALASQNKTDIASIMKLNPTITDANKIQAGAFLNLPDMPSLAPTPTPAVNTTDSLRKELKDGGADIKKVTALPDQPTFEAFKADLQPKDARPTAPNLVAEYQKLRDDYGITPLEEKITGYKDQKQKLVDKFRQYETTAGGAETLGVMRGRISEEGRAVQNEIDNITRLEELATNQLSLKNSTISNIIGLTKDDYNTANARWNDEFSQNVQLQNAFDNRIDKNQTTARATITTMQNMLKDSGLSFSDLDPTTKAQVESLELKAGLPAGITEFAYKNAPADKLISTKAYEDANGVQKYDFVRERRDGSTYIQTITGGQGKAPGGGTGGGEDAAYSGLSATVINKIDSLASKFGDKDIVKKYIATVDATNVVNGIESTSKNPADHQAIVYAFAKALDPDSAVKEGEYETIKKYAQGTFSRYKKEIEHAINGSGFLSEKAIENIQTTISNLEKSRRPQYDNFYSETSRVINNKAGRDIADQVLIDFTGGVRSGTKLVSPDGTQEVNLSDLTPAQIEEAKAAGWK